MIRSKIEARERALELAIEFSKGTPKQSSTVVEDAKAFEKYLVGDAEFPEVYSEYNYVKELVDTLAENSRREAERQTKEFEAIMGKTFGDVPSMGIVGTCKAPAQTEEQTDEGVN